MQIKLNPMKVKPSLRPYAIQSGNGSSLFCSSRTGQKAPMTPAHTSSSAIAERPRCRAG